ncbi:MAG: DDE-type integrase/transposase/recombinase [Planctomycetota bacterium]
MSRDLERTARRWAELRFAIIGQLLADPPKRGELQRRLRELSQKFWTHPKSGELVRFSVSTIERWYYAAQNGKRDPVGQLTRQRRKDAGKRPSISAELAAAIAAQYRQHQSWSYVLHFDNLVALGEGHPELGEVPSYSTVRRHMVDRGFLKRRRRPVAKTEAQERAARRLEEREVRSYENEYVSGLWHLDFHVGSRAILTPKGEWIRPKLFGVLDDHSRLACHAQWYLEETAEALVHGLSQAFQKRGLPRSLLTDNGSAMRAEEVRRGLLDLSVVHQTTLDYSPYQNGKQERFWGTLEGRLMKMLEGVPELTLELLNRTTLAWMEADYNRRLHSEIGQTPLERFASNDDVSRPCPSSLDLRRAFRIEARRKPRRGDATISLEGQRFEIPSHCAHLPSVFVRYARWDLSHVDLVDPHTGAIVAPIQPIDKALNAEGRRRRRAHPGEEDVEPSRPEPSGMAPLLEKILREQERRGLPPAYLSFDSDRDPTHTEDPS